MKRVTDPALLAQLDQSTGLSAPFDQSAEQPNPLFNFLAGAGGAIQDNLAALPFSPIPKAPPAQGIAGGIGNVAGNIASFLGGGELLEGARAAAEALPTLGQLAKALSGEGVSGLARRIIGTSLGGALENSKDRLQGATKGALLGSLGESVPLGLQALGKTAEFISPQSFTNDLVQSIKKNYQLSKQQAKQYYDAIFNPIGQEKIVQNEYAQLNPEYFHTYDAKLKELHRKFINHPTLEAAHQLQSQIGSKMAQLQTKAQDIATSNAMTDLSKARSTLQEDITQFLQQHFPTLAKQHQIASQFFKQSVIPYRSQPFVSDISTGEIKNAKPKKLAQSLEQLLQSDRHSIPLEHPLQIASQQLTDKINRGDMTSKLASLMAGMSLGELAHPGLSGIFGGLIGGGAAHHFVVPKLMDLAVNPYAIQKIQKLSSPYQWLAKSVVANELPQGNTP